MRQGLGTVAFAAAAAALALAVAYYSVAGKTGSDAAYSVEIAAPSQRTEVALAVYRLEILTDREGRQR